MFGFRAVDFADDDFYFPKVYAKSMRTLKRLTVWLLVCCLSAAKLAVATEAPIEILKINRAADHSIQSSGDEVILKNRMTIKHIGFSLESLGVINGNGFAALILSGAECTECDADTEVLVRTMADSKTHRFRFPGKVTVDSANPSYSRTFFGSCTSAPGDSLVEVLDYEKNKTLDIWQMDKKGTLSKTTTKNDLTLEEILSKVRLKKCKEIEGHDRDLSSNE